MVIFQRGVGSTGASAPLPPRDRLPSEGADARNHRTRDVMCPLELRTARWIPTHDPAMSSSTRLSISVAVMPTTSHTACKYSFSSST